MRNRRIISALTAFFIITVTVLPARAGEEQDRVNAAYARLHAKQAAASQPSTITNAEVDQLRSEITSLRAENAKLRALYEKAANAVVRAEQENAQRAAQAAAPADSKVADAIAKHTLADGMTVAQAEQSLSLEFKKIGEENSDGQQYFAVADRKQLPFRMIPGFGMTGGQITGIEYRLSVKDGVVIYWSKKPFSLDPGQAAVGDSRIR